ncbi:MAG: DegV family protein [Thermodesulfobacteriota bacterium]
MGGIAVVTDSLGNIPAETATKHDINVIPFHIVLNGRAYLEGRDITYASFYKRYDLYHVKKVEAPPEHDYVLFYMKLARMHPAMVLLHSSASPGNLFATALSVHEKMRHEHGCKVACVDTGTLGPAHGLLAILAAQAAAAGATMHQVLSLLFSAIPQTRLYIHPGATRGTRKLPGGGLFRATPVLTVGKKGELAPADEVKVKKGRFLMDMARHAREDAGGQPVMLAVTAPDPEALNERILPPFEESLDCRLVMAEATCPSVAVDLGPEAIQIAYVKLGGLGQQPVPGGRIAA